MASVDEINQKIFGFFTGIGDSGSGIVKIITWGIFIIVLIALGWYGYYYYKNKKIFSKKITAFDIVGINFVPVIRDVAKTVKIGSGGFEILYLKKLKVWKIAYGGKVGKDTYYFFILPDGYWYNGMLSANMNLIDKNGGLIPVVTTNPTMRSQYTSLEKQIDSLQKTKQTFMEKYGGWIAAISFVLVAGVMLWLSYGKYAESMGALSGLIDKIGGIAASVCNSGGGTPSGLVPIG